MNYQNRADLCIAQGALTNSKRPECLIKGVYPTHLVKGDGAFVYDTEAKSYFDLTGSLGAVLFGHSNELINRAIIDALSKGILFPLASTIEVDFAERLKQHFNFIDLIKIFKSGSEACISSLKIARSYTGRSLVLTDGYHGHIDEFVSIMPPAFGCVQKDHIKKLVNVSDITSEVAAVIVEPVLLDDSRERVKYLESLRAKCDETGTLLIFDEVITGMRFRNYSVSKAFGVYPDLIVLGKGLANGMPLGVVGGKKHILNDKEYFVSGTFAGERLSLAAACKVLDLYTEHPIESLWFSGEDFKNKFNRIAPEIILIEGYATRGRWNGSDENKALFFQECCKAGIIVNPSWFWSHALIPHKEILLHTMSDILFRIKTNQVKLEGEMFKNPFASKFR